MSRNGKERPPRWARDLSADVRASLREAEKDRKAAAEDRKFLTKLLIQSGERHDRAMKAFGEALVKIDRTLNRVIQLLEHQGTVLDHHTKLLEEILRSLKSRGNGKHGFNG
ncbi:MAG: hypothetical protein HY716_07505 [Planctomycetes bacterium]|nr:hypothetical protein [Planctomycetota bacterium]